MTQPVTSPELPRVLCVDDDWNLLSGLERTLRGQFNVKMTHTPSNAIAILTSDPGFAVVMSDLRMPGMQGTTFLDRVRRLAPDAVRVLFTGQAELSDAVAAVNEGQIFRFLLKPCPSALVVKTVLAAVEQHRLVQAERTLLQVTLRETVSALMDVLVVSHPIAFSRAMRLRRYAVEASAQIDAAERWQIELAALLSPLGSITMGAETLERLRIGEKLPPEEQALADAAPNVAARLIGSIPRLEPVRDILAHVHARFDGSGPIRFSVAGTRIPFGARVIKLGTDFEIALSRSASMAGAVEALEARRSWYDPELVAPFLERRREEAEALAPIDVRLSGVRPGMMFLEDVVIGGTVVAARRQEITPSLIERIKAHWRELAQTLTVRVLAPRDAAVAERMV
jgi:response regulator RpfG family c-di-GMP phosphodiesterase